MDTAFPSLWEVSGGSIDKADPSIARGVLEETGLRLTWFVGLVGEAINWRMTEVKGTINKSNDIRWLKFSFEIEAAEVGGGSKTEQEVEGYLRFLPGDLDPLEHQGYS